MVCQPFSPTLWVDSPTIEAGTSGSPIVNGIGELVGIVSNAGGTLIEKRDNKCSGRHPRPNLALPVWVLNQITGE